MQTDPFAFEIIYSSGRLKLLLSLKKNIFMYVKKEMAFSMTLFHIQSFRMQFLELNFCDYHGYYSLTSSILR